MIDFREVGYELARKVSGGASLDFDVGPAKRCKRGIPCGDGCISKKKKCKETGSNEANIAAEWLQKNAPKTVKKLTGDPMKKYPFEDEVQRKIYETNGDRAKDRTQAFMKAHGAPPPPETQIAALYGYTTSLYKPMNSVLRHGSYGDREARFAPKDHDLTQDIRMATKAIANAPETARYEGEVFRGTRVPESIIAQYKEGETITESAFVSTTRSSTVANKFIRLAANDGKETVVYRIKSKSGVRLDDLSKYPKEEEVLFSPGTKFKVNKVSKDSEKGYEIELEEVADLSATEKIISEMDAGQYQPPYPLNFKEDEEGDGDISEKMSFPIGMPDE
ncbi:MAG TPA: ADP-ribosyltransferase domain-containing protein [Vampirovibrionales bacterium]